MGNYEARAHLNDHSSEIGLLGSAFDQMADALAARHAAQHRAEEELRQLNTTLEARIRQRTMELEGAIRAKSQFLANMSHEIRTPLNGVLGMLELVRQTDLGQTQQRFVETARRSAQTLLGVINQILDLSKIEAGKVELEHSEFDLRTVIEEVTETFADSAYSKGLELACFVPAGLPVAFTTSQPAANCPVTRCALPMSLVQRIADKPYIVSFATRIASASSRKDKTDSTGPKISSRASFCCGETLSKITGGT